jgi:lipopolysaccharide/colanic/teichoic acid biosynthesis glycosyltransferase
MLVKRSFDLILSLILIFLFLPLLFLIYLLIYFSLGSPVIYKHERPGLNSNLFILYKFRTMTEELSEDGSLLSDDERITKVGSLMRSLSLDELPELYNILIGDMSFVGPRPLLVEYLDLYDDIQSRRHDVRPGITGLAQIKGRNSISWKKRFKLDVWYVDNRSLLLDLKILFLTIPTVLSREGVSEEGSSTMSRFKGDE